MKLTGAQALIKSLEMEGVEVIFGLPGGCILPVYDPIIDSPIRHILVRHEQGAGHMAEGYAHVTGPSGRGHGDAAARRPPTSSRRCATPTWTRSRWSSSPVRCRPPRSAPTPSRSATPSASPARSPSTTSW